MFMVLREKSRYKIPNVTFQIHTNMCKDKKMKETQTINEIIKNYFLPYIYF